MSVRFLSVLAVLLCCSISKAVEVPVSAMWGHAIDATQNISLLAPSHYNKDGTRGELIEPSPIAEISGHLSHRWKEKPEGFVVKGSAEHALLTAKQQLVDEAEPQELDDTNRLWLFFYTLSGPLTMRIESVKIEDHRIDVRYKFPKKQAGGNMASLPHFALIPIGTLEAGEYDVMIPKNEFVCDSFKFYVEESR